MKYKITLALILFLQAALTFADASLSITPYLVQLEQNDRTATIYLANRGDASGRYEITFVHKKMDENGNLTEALNQEFDLSPFLRVSPKTVELKPFETQIIKLNLRKSKDAKAIEYYTHMRVLTTDNNVEEHAKDDENESSNLINIETRQAISIPVFWKNTRENASLIITKIHYQKKSEQLIVHFDKQMPVSSRGFLYLYAQSDEKNERPLIKKFNVVIYGNLQERAVIIEKKKLSLDKNFPFNQAVKAVFYKNNEKDILFEQNDIQISVTE